MRVKHSDGRALKPDHKVGELLLRLDGDADAAVHLLPVLRCRPVLDAPE